MDRHFGVPLNCIELAQQHLEIVQELLVDPQGTMAVLDESLRLAQEHVVSEQQDSNENMTIKVRIAASFALSNSTYSFNTIQRAYAGSGTCTCAWIAILHGP